MQIRPHLVALSAAALLIPLSARADWTRWSQGDASVYLNAISSPDGRHVFVAGDSIDTSGSLPSLHPRIYASGDRGHTFTEIGGSLANLSGFNSTSAIAFIDAQTGWVAVGNNIHRTTNGGASWASSSVGQSTTALQGFDAMNVTRVGKRSSTSFSSNGGSTWTPGSGTGSGLTFERMFWLDRQRGWATADFVGEDGIATQTQLFRTTDGGSTWTETWNRSGMGAGPVFFLADGRTGWVATYEQTSASADPPDPYPAQVHLFRTTDGGDTLTDIGLPTQVGTLKGLFNSTSPIHLARLYAMHWDDARHGHLVGGAFQGSATGGMSGGMTSTSQTVTSWRVADYRTEDGSTWDKTDLGLITPSGLNLPPSDGQFNTGLMLDSENGWLVADSQTVWGYQTPCTAQDTCPAGYLCQEGHCAAGTPQGGGTDGGGSSQAGDGGSFVLNGKPEDSVRTGCQCGATNSSLLLLLLPLVRRRSRDRSPT